MSLHSLSVLYTKNQLFFELDFCDAFDSIGNIVINLNSIIGYIFL